MIKFYNRKAELVEMHEIYKQCNTHGKMTVLTGRRRVGKTMLALEFAKKHKHLYLFVSRKSELLLCDEFMQQIKAEFDMPVVGKIASFREVFELLLQLSATQRFTLIIDEFQEFYNINPSVFSDIQNFWDRYKRKSKMNLIFIGSVYSLMYKIFQDSKEPLFNRADRMIFLKPFPVKEISRILQDHKKSNDRLLFDYYIFTGGMPIYIDMLLTQKTFTRNKIIDFIFNASSPLLYEGRNVLIEEFGKEYGTYFSILSLIASGKTARPEIESILEHNIGGYLDRLENDFAILSKHRPIGDKPNSKSVKYKIRDNFLNFWFRFIYKNMTAVETENFSYIKDLIERDYDTFSGLMLESMFREMLAASQNYNEIGSWWDRKGENEIDIVAVNDMKKEILFAEVKLNPKRASLTALEVKAAKLLPEYPGYKTDYVILSTDDIGKYL